MNNIPSDRYIEKSISIFKLLSDETRVKILISIIDENKTVTQIVNDVNQSQSCISHQLKLLKEEHMVKSERKGKCIYYSLDDEHVRNLLLQTFEHSLEGK